ncbi:hypothetical protein [Streptomyces sp. CA-288835]|uniref:hypothetical protein n=1 Tax=Streptomyces sp. CA-288835 TaxID=3240069 RepID=UPI003D920DA8
MLLSLDSHAPAEAIVAVAARAETKRRIYNLARDGKLTRYGGKARGQALWDRAEIIAIGRAESQ